MHWSTRYYFKTRSSYQKELLKRRFGKTRNISQREKSSTKSLRKVTELCSIIFLHTSLNTGLIKDWLISILNTIGKGSQKTMNGETVVLFLSLTSTLVMMILLLAVFKLFRANQKISAEMGIEHEDMFSFKISHPTHKALFYPILVLSIAAMLFAITTLIEGSVEVAVYLFGISLITLAISGYCLTQNTKPTQTTSINPPKSTQTQPFETPTPSQILEKQEPPQRPETETYQYCSQCGYKNENGDVYCQRCGKKYTKIA